MINHPAQAAADALILDALKNNVKKSLMKRLDAVVSEITEDAAAFGIFDSDENEYRQYRVLMAQLEAVAITLADESFAAILD